MNQREGFVFALHKARGLFMVLVAANAAAIDTSSCAGAMLRENIRRLGVRTAAVRSARLEGCACPGK